MLDEGLGIADVLAREGDGPRRRSEIHAFFADLASWLDGDDRRGLRPPRRGPGAVHRRLLPLPRPRRGGRHLPLQPDLRLLLRRLRRRGPPRGLERGPRDDRRRGLPRAGGRPPRRPLPERQLHRRRADAAPGSPPLRPPREGARPQGQPDLERPEARRGAGRRAGRRRPGLGAALARGPDPGAPRRPRRPDRGVRPTLGRCRAAAGPRHPRPHQYDAHSPQPARVRGHRRPRGRPRTRPPDDEPGDPLRKRGRPRPTSASPIGTSATTSCASGREPRPAASSSSGTRPCRSASSTRSPTASATAAAPRPTASCT